MEFLLLSIMINLFQDLFSKFHSTNIISSWLFSLSSEKIFSSLSSTSPIWFPLIYKPALQCWSVFNLTVMFFCGLKSWSQFVPFPEVECHHESCMGTGTSDVFSCFLLLLFDSRGRSYFHFLGWFCSFELLTTFPFALKESGLTVPRFGRPNLHRCPLLPGPASSPCVCWPGSGHPEPLAGPTPALLGHPLDRAQGLRLSAGCP